MANDQLTLKQVPSQRDIATQVGFVMVYQEKDLTTLSADGSVGLAPNKLPRYASETFLSSLTSKGVIKAQIFSLLLQHHRLESKVWFGDYSIPQLRSSLAQKYDQVTLGQMTDQEVVNEIKWTRLASYFYWSTTLRQITIADTTIAVTSTAIVYNSITREIQAPRVDYEALISYFTNEKDCSLDDDKTLCICDGEQDPSYPTIKFQIDDTVTLDLAAVWYLRYHSDNVFG